MRIDNRKKGEEKVSDVSLEELLKEKAFSIGYCLKCKTLVQAEKHHCPQCNEILHKEEADRTIYVYDVLAFVANFNKALQSKDLAYKTMEKAYIRLSKKLDGLRKLRNDLEEMLTDYRWQNEHDQHTIKEVLKRLDAQLGDLEK